MKMAVCLLTAAFMTVLAVFLGHSLNTYAADYTVDFVASDDYSRRIFNSQKGSASEGADISVTYPEQIIGSDGYIWKAVLESPRSFTPWQEGVHKYYIEFQRGEKVKDPEDPEAGGKKKLEEWLKTVWKADCAITGQNPEGAMDPYLTVTRESENNSRIKNLVSMLSDAQWHYFYMIGRNYVPQTLVIGTSFDAAYSSVKEESFSVGTDRYHVVKVGVKRNWKPEACTHDWEVTGQAPENCLKDGIASYRCKKCGMEENIVLPAQGHKDGDQDSLCDSCGERAFSQTVGDSIRTMVQTEEGEVTVSFTCVDGNYRGSGLMLYLSDEVLSQEMTGLCYDEAGGYNDSPIRHYLNLAVVNDCSLKNAMQPFSREDGVGLTDFGALLSRAEYEEYKARGLIKETEKGYFLRTFDADDTGGHTVFAVNTDGAVESVPTAGNTSFGARPFILLKTPTAGEQAEPHYWKEGDIQMRRVGKKSYRFICTDEDYSDSREGHQRAALFLCDSVIRADIDSDALTFQSFSFGRDNNYKTSDIRKWLEENSAGADFNLEPVSIGVDRAYTGSTERGTFEQLAENRLKGYDIGFQLMQERLFCLSLEEALKYKDGLWRFNGAGENNPDSQISPYSAGYYLRTPFYAEDESGVFQYSQDVYVVDLANGNIHTAGVDSEAYGIRPAFAVPQEQIKK